MVKELMPIYDNAKSFYGKAEIGRKGDTVNLYSYDTLVAYIDNDGYFKIVGFYSATTLRHIKEFYKQFYGTLDADEKITKKDLLKYLIKK